MKKKLTGLLALVLAFAVVLPAVPAAAIETDSSFSDVNKGDWFYDDVMECAKFEIVNGFGDGSFKPLNPLKRGEFLKMLAICTEAISLKDRTGVHWAEEYWNILDEQRLLEWRGKAFSDAGGNLAVNTRPIFDCTPAEMEKPITRYEMAYLINSFVFNFLNENTVTLSNPGESIKDYAGLNADYRNVVAQAYGKGILNGYSDGRFGGDDPLTRAQAAAVIVRMLEPPKRVDMTKEAKEDVVEVDTSTYVGTLKPEDSFSFRYRSMSEADRRTALFGNPNKAYFTSAADAGDHITTLKVNTWDIDKNGNKYTRTWNLQVNVVVADEVAAIFETIYNDPEKFPIHALGGARYTDTMRHAWGCAIDINPVENYYIVYSTGQTVGNFCYLNGSSPYCITPECSVVRAFAKYGWGWGGKGWSNSADYMHFSVLASGG